MTDGPWPGVPAGGPRLRPADDDPDVLLVRTASSTHRLDLRQRTATRMAGWAANGGPNYDIADLRRDGEPLPIIRIVQLQVGLPMVLLLQVREDGLPTIRTSTPVQEIR